MIIVGVILLGVGVYYVWPSATNVTVVATPTPSATAPVVTPSVTTPVATTTATTTVTTTTTATTTTATTTASSTFTLSPAQKQALINAGVSTSSVPNTVSAAQEACFVTKLGAARVATIKTGAVPTVADLLKAKGCI